MASYNWSRTAVVAVCLGLAGCTTGTVASPNAQPALFGPNVRPGDRVVPGSVDQVCALTEKALFEVNLLSSVSRLDYGLRLECRTATDARFSIVLTTVGSKLNALNVEVAQRRKFTRVHVGWEHAKEPENGLNDPIIAKVLDRVEVLCREEQKKQDTPQWR